MKLPLAYPNKYILLYAKLENPRLKNSKVPLVLEL